MIDSSEIERRNNALLHLDLNYARELMPDATDEVRLLSLHKARVEHIFMPSNLRLESIEWLRERGFKRMHGLALPPVGELPV